MSQWSDGFVTGILLCLLLAEIGLIALSIRRERQGEQK